MVPGAWRDKESPRTNTKPQTNPYNAVGAAASYQMVVR